jgi:PAS domain S-box-containing protein
MKLQKDFLIPLIYGIAGFLWITFSDQLLFSHFDTKTFGEQMYWVSTLKGYFYVVLTSVLLYFLILARTRFLVSSKNDFKRLFEENPNPMWIYDQETLRILLVNKAACNEYGYNKEEFLELSLLDLRNEEDFEKLILAVHNSQTGFKNSGVWLHKRKDGSTFYVNIYSHSTIYEQKPCRIVTAINIHQRIQSDIEKNNIKNALDNAALVFITDTSGIIIEVNEKFCTTYGYQADEIVGNSHIRFNSGYHSQEFWADMWLHIRKGKVWRADVCNITKEGQKVWIDTIITPVLNSEGKIYKYLAIGYDITSKKHLERKLKTQNQQLAEIAWVQSHEVRRPVANILGIIGLLQTEKSYNELYVQYLLQSAEELDAIIHKIVAQTNEISHFAE